MVQVGLTKDIDSYDLITIKNIPGIFRFLSRRYDQTFDFYLLYTDN